ncbi:MAG: radical SAM protein [Alistipes sp.]|nr:radical SAM protein [Alistipes sp.]
MMNKTFFRPEWTCGRYNPSAQVALMYNLIEGKSFFFESHSANVIAEVLAVGRNGVLDIERISQKTNIPTESIIEFFDDVLTDVGLVTTKIFSKDEIHAMRKKWSRVNKKESPHYHLANLKNEGIIDSQTAEIEYNKYLNPDTNIYSVMLELTYNCSEKCIHCYNMGATRNDDEKSGRCCLAEMDINDYKKLIDELDSLGCYKVCLSGGDPFAKPIAWEIIDYLYQKEIAFDIFTNGLAITTKVDRLIDYYPRLVGISIYSGVPEIHDKITRIKGSFEKSISVAEKLSEYGVPMTFKCVVMKPNLKSYHFVKGLAKKYGAVFQIETNLCMGVDGDMSMINHLRLSKEEFEILLCDKDIPLYVGLDMPNEGRVPKPADAYPCSGGWGTYTITPDGNMVICSSMHWILGNVTTQPIAEILKSERLQEWRNTNIGKIEGCGTKPECDYCNLCSGNNYNEHGVLTKPSSVNCWLAKVRYDLMQKLKEGYDPLCGLPVETRLAIMGDYEVERFGKEIIEH